MANLHGVEGEEVLAGTNALDRLDGSGGDDTLEGGVGSDFPNGGARADRLDGDLAPLVWIWTPLPAAQHACDSVKSCRIRVKSNNSSYGCAVTRRRFSAGANPARQLSLQPATPDGPLRLEQDRRPDPGDHRGLSARAGRCKRARAVAARGLAEWLPEGHSAHHVSDLVDGVDLTAFYAPYTGDGRRNAPYEPRMMVKC